MGGVSLTPHLLAFVVSFVRYTFVSGAQVNRTIDDTHGDIHTGQLVTYTPPLKNSHSRWTDQTCQGCLVLPNDPSEAFMGTFHGATHKPSILATINFQLNFTGTAIYVFFTLVNDVNTFVNFTIDNTPAGFYTYNANSQSITQYHVPVFSQTNLQNSQHSVLLSAAPNSVFSYVNFDYALYTQDDGISETVLPPLSGTVLTSSLTSSSQSFPSSSALVTHKSRGHLRSKTRNFNNSYSSTPFMPGQPSITTVIDTAAIISSSWSTNPTSTLPSTPGSIRAARQSGPTHLAIAGAVLGPVSVLVAAGFLLRYIQSRKQENLKKQNPTPFIYIPQGNPSAEDSGIVVPPTKRGSHGKISTLPSQRVRDALRRTRQEEIEQRLHLLRGEIVEISSKLSARGAMVPAASRSQSNTAHQRSTETGDELESSERLRRMLSTKNRQIEHLEAQRQSPWALGLSENPPFEDANLLL